GPREPFQLVGPGADAIGEARVWVGQGFETGTTPQFAGLLAATMVAGRPRLVLWRPTPPVRLPGVLVGSTETAPGVLRLWNVAGQLFSEQAQFFQPATDGAGGGGGGGRTGRGGGEAGRGGGGNPAAERRLSHVGERPRSRRRDAQRRVARPARGEPARRTGGHLPRRPLGGCAAARCPGGGGPRGRGPGGVRPLLRPAQSATRRRQ